MKTQTPTAALLTALLITALAGAVLNSVNADPADFSKINLENSWLPRPPMLYGSEAVRTAVVNGKIYVITVVDGAFHEYDPAALAWTQKTPMPNSTRGSMAVYQGKIYVIGEHYNEVYDVAADKWTSKTSMPTRRLGVQASVVGGKIYVIGGMSATEPGKFSDLNEVYDPHTDTWTTKKPIPTPVSSYASAMLDNKIYIIGGDSEPPNVVEGYVQIYDPQTDTWTSGKPMPSPVRSASAGATTGMFAPKRIYVIGGSGAYPASGTNLTQVYDPQTDSWTEGALMPTARYGLGVAVVNDTLYAMGGVLLPPYAFPKEPLAANEVYLPFGYEGPLPPDWSPTSSSSSSTNSPTPSAPNIPSSSPPHLEQPTETAEPQPESPTTTLLVASTASATITCMGLLVYFKKRKH